MILVTNFLRLHIFSKYTAVDNLINVSAFLMTNGLTMHGAKTSSNVKEKWCSMRKHAAEKRANRSCTAGNVPAAFLKASRLCAGRLHDG